MTTSDAFFGFGALATGAPEGTTITSPKNLKQLQAALQSLSGAGSGPFFISIGAGEYDLGKTEFIIRTKRLTLQAAPNARVVLKNLTLRVDLSSIDQVLIRGLAFQSDRSTSSDAIRLGPSDDAKPTPGTTAKANVRIAYCSFDGFQDIAICSRSSINFPQLLATIDHCLFVDSKPGKPLSPLRNDKFPFVDRGAINFGSLETPGKADKGKKPTEPPQQPNYSRVTIAENAFVDIWRRTPRIANGNFGRAPKRSPRNACSAC